MGVIATLSAFAVMVSYLAIRAQADAQLARNATRMAAARELQSDPTTVLALLREVEPPEVPRGWTTLARWALHSWVARVVLTHPDFVIRAAFSPDGKHIATVCADRAVRVWNADGTGEPLVFRGHEGPINSVAFSPDGERIVTASDDRTARVWSTEGYGRAARPPRSRGGALFGGVQPRWRSHRRRRPSTGQRGCGRRMARASSSSFAVTRSRSISRCSAVTAVAS